MTITVNFDKPGKFDSITIPIDGGIYKYPFPTYTTDTYSCPSHRYGLNVTGHTQVPFTNPAFYFNETIDADNLYINTDLLTIGETFDIVFLIQYDNGDSWDQFNLTVLTTFPSQNSPL